MSWHLFSLAASLFAMAACSSYAVATPEVEQDLARKTTRFLAAVANDQPDARMMIERTLVMGFESGTTQPSDWAAYAAELPKFGLESVDNRGTDVLISMLGSQANAQKCRDRLLSWLRPAGSKLELTFSVQQSAQCSQPVRAVPVPADGAK